MPYKKGKSGNPDGRPKGAQGRLNKELRQAINDFLERRWPDIEKAFDKLSDMNKVTFYRELLQYRLPKLESMSVSELGFENLSDEQLEIIYNKLKLEYGTNSDN